MVQPEYRIVQITTFEIVYGNYAFKSYRWNKNDPQNFSIKYSQGVIENHSQYERIMKQQICLTQKSLLLVAHIFMYSSKLKIQLPEVIRNTMRCIPPFIAIIHIPRFTLKFTATLRRLQQIFSDQLSLFPAIAINYSSSCIVAAY